MITIMVVLGMLGGFGGRGSDDHPSGGYEPPYESSMQPPDCRTLGCECGAVCTYSSYQGEWYCLVSLSSPKPKP